MSSAGVEPQITNVADSKNEAEIGGGSARNPPRRGIGVLWMTQR